MRAFSSCGKQVLLSRSGVQASHCGGLSCCRAQALGTHRLQWLWHVGSIVIVRRKAALQHVGSSWSRQILYQCTTREAHIPLYICTTSSLGLCRWCSGKISVCQCRRTKRCSFNHWVKKIPGERNGNPLQHSCLENSTDRGAWWATDHGIAQSDMTERAHTHTHHLFFIHSSVDGHLGCFHVLAQMGNKNE